MKSFFKMAFPSSPRKLIFIVTAAVFLSESISMVVIFALQPFSLSDLTETIIDSSLLVILLSPILYFFVFRPMLLNLNERKQAEEALKRLNRELRQTTSELSLAYKDMESFSYSISHDLRAPIRIIGGMSDIVLQDNYDKLGDEGKKLLTSIHGQAERMDKLVLALLAVSKVGKQEMEMKEIDMEKEARLIVSDLKAAAPERYIEVTVDHLHPAYGDITLIRQVLTNLLSNAVKFTRLNNPAHIVVGGSSEGNEEIYFVKDDGAGFDMTYANKLFHVFHRMHTEMEFEGMGIGLSIVERIIRRHGGRVWAEGRPHEGATFYFSLPRKIGGFGV